MFDPLTRAIARWQRRRLAIRELHALSDHMMSDIGLRRAHVAPFVACIAC